MKRFLEKALSDDARSMTQAEEAELARRWQTKGDRAAAERLVREHGGMVVAQALRYRHHGIPLCDLVGEGNLGLMRALGKFEPQRGVPFAAYASYWVKAGITHCVSARRGLRSALFFRLNRERARVVSELGASDVVEEILAQRLSVSLELVKDKLARLDARFVAYNADLHHAPLAWGRMTDSCDQEQALANSQDEQQLKLCVERALASLDPRERYIAEQRLMSDEQERPTLNQLAQQLKVSRERVGHLEARAKRKLRERIGNASIDVLQCS